MTARALLGLVLLNGFVLTVGTGVLWGIRGWRSWAELARLSGFAYMLGVAALGVALSIELVAGTPFSLATILLSGLALAGAGLVAGRLLGRPRPALRGGAPARIGLVTAAFGAAVVVYLEAVFRAARLQALSAWDAWSFWVPKAKMLYFEGGLDAELLRQLANPTYPPVVPALEASAFHFMGSADAVTLHVQFWFFLAGFAAASVGLLSTRVRPLLLWPILLLVLAAPRIVGRAVEPQADFLLDYFFALAALLVLLWLLEREPWQLVAATAFLGAAMLTKREGQLLAACVVAAALAATWRERRRTWPWLVLSGGTALAVALPWRLWFTAHDLSGELPRGGSPGALLENAERAWPAFESFAEAAFDYGLWLVVPALAVAAIALAFIGGARILPVYASLVFGLAGAGFVWVLWSFAELELPLVQDEAVNPIVRLSGSLVLLAATLAPPLLEAAWRGCDPPGEESA